MQDIHLPQENNVLQTVDESEHLKPNDFANLPNCTTGPYNWQSFKYPSSGIVMHSSAMRNTHGSNIIHEKHSDKWSLNYPMQADILSELILKGLIILSSLPPSLINQRKQVVLILSIRTNEICAAPWYGGQLYPPFAHFSKRAPIFSTFFATWKLSITNEGQTEQTTWPEDTNSESVYGKGIYSCKWDRGKWKIQKKMKREKVKCWDTT